jgi:tRNA threonylcarbamoyladenosine biosynthesis protein TsaE
MIVSLEDINLVVEKLYNLINKKDIIVLLRGDLASGKTTLVKEYIKYLGIDQEVTSPTFSIQSHYGLDIYHYDMYNKTLQEFVSLGLIEEFEKSGIHFVEWGEEDLESILNQYGFDFIIIQINKLENKREYIIEA